MIKKTTKKILLSVIAVVSMSSCASSYKMISPKSLNYVSKVQENKVEFSYKYNLLDKKYEKKESKKGIKLIAVKVSNNSGKDLMFGNDIKLMTSEAEVITLENENLFSKLKQRSATYLWYLLLSPLQLNKTETDSRGIQETQSIFPLGLILGPGIAGANFAISAGANKKLKTELLDYNIVGSTIKNGETKFGLIGIEADNFDALQIKIVE